MTPIQPALSGALVAALLAGSLLTGCDDTGETSSPAGNPAPDTAGNATGFTADNAGADADDGWVAELEARLESIDEQMPGRLGVHVRRIGGAQLDRGGDRDWYLASTIKVPLGIAVLEQVESGDLSLDQTITVQQGDFVDGAGDLIWQDPGFEISIGDLIAKSIRDSDSTATDILLRLLGEDHVNRRVADWSGGGFNDITTIVDVRYDVYGPAHPGVADLSNMDIVGLRNADAGEPRLQALADALGVARSELAADDFDTLFEDYYAGGLNAGRLEAFGTLLERLVQGELLDETHTGLLIGHMQAITTGDARIAAGLPGGTAFAQKTGTQIARACNVGVLNPEATNAVVVAACAEAYDDIGQAEEAFQALGRALAEVGLLD